MENTVKNLKNAIEAILFAIGEPIKATKLSNVLNVSIDCIKEAVSILQYDYDSQKRGFMIIDIDDGFQICSRPDYHVYIQEILGEQRKQALSNAAMEVLAIIAYGQPITRSQVENVRGVNSDGAINRLLERGLIDEAGRLDAPGRPILYSTTHVFLRSFGLKNIKDLPPLDMELVNNKFEQITLDEAANSTEFFEKKVVE